ncbi:D-isomer specific 2-hydroxyacid dehydrogenase family protein [Arcticibacter sp. MXS-1]|uniref:D-isomer specific 2-hydroxyacid dehydrogenase family protein n=1 Tax=Arcticibacter sp. MXS-1 TaxID=3341726 RepID=UPI0035A97739
MKLTAFEVREDEVKVFAMLASQYGIEIAYVQQLLSPENVDLAEGSAGVTVLGFSQVSREVLSQLKALGVSFLSTRTIGYNHIDLAAATELGIRVSNANYGPHGVADYTVMLMLMSLRKYKQALFRANVNDYSLNGLQGREMKDMTIGIVGTGKIGSKVIDNLSGFGSRILAYDTIVNEHVSRKAEYVSLDELYRQSDIISLHVPLFESTAQMINKESIAKMKDGVILVNCARGELMNITDLISAIEHEKIGALALDVFEKEEGIYHFDRRTDIIKNRDMAYIRQFPNVIMTQHIAFYTDTAVGDMVSFGVKSLVSFVQEGRAETEIFFRP